MDLVAKYGSDAFRLGILRGRSAGMNQAFSENSVIAGRNLCNKLWNISRFVQSIVDESSMEFENTFIEGGSEPGKARSSAETPVATGVSDAPQEESVSNSCAANDNSIESSEDNSLLGRSGGHDRGGEEREPRNDGRERLRSEKSVSSDGYTTDNMGEDWICRELNNCLEQVSKCMADYRFAEAVDVLYQTIWDKYADWFLESQKIYKNSGLLKHTLETILIALHPFAPFVTETIWQNLSWTEGFIISAKWPSKLKYDPISAENFETIRTIVSETRATLQALPGANNAKKYGLLYDNDSIIADNQLLIKTLSKVPTINSLKGSPRGLRLALANHELFLDVPEKVVKDFKDALTERILAVGRELDNLNLRMSNPNYVNKAPEHLVKETKDQIKEKEALITRLKAQFNLI